MTSGVRRKDVVARLPKAELHVHLEGAIQPATLLSLARRHGVDLPGSTEEDLRRFFRFRDFDHFVEMYLLCSSCLKVPEDFQLVVEDFLAEQERQRVLYTEAHLTISTHIANGVNAGEVADALRETIEGCEKRRGVRLRLIADIVRNAPFARADQTLEWALDDGEGLVVALGLGGIEQYSCEPFREHFREAERAGLSRVAHAGEQTTADDVDRVLDACNPQRIGHGIRSAGSPATLARLRSLGIPLEICPSSNVRLGYCGDYESHPLAELERAGLKLSINSDDPTLFGTTLNDEYLIAAKLLALDSNRLVELARSSLEHAFLEEAERSRYERAFDLEIAPILAEVAW